MNINDLAWQTKIPQKNNIPILRMLRIFICTKKKQNKKKFRKRLIHLELKYLKVKMLRCILPHIPYMVHDITQFMHSLGCQLSLLCLTQQFDGAFVRRYNSGNLRIFEEREKFNIFGNRKSLCSQICWIVGWRLDLRCGKGDFRIVLGEFTFVLYNF